MKSHLANYCTKTPASVVREYLQKLSGEMAKKKCKTIGQHSIEDFHDLIKELPKGHISQINRALAKAFICAGLPFQAIENLFFVNFLKELNLVYHPPF